MKRIWKRYLAALLVFTMVMNSTGATVLAETVRNGLASHVQNEENEQNLNLATDSVVKNEGELASGSDASPSDADIPCTKNDDCEALPGNHDPECPLYEGALLDDVSTPSNAILAIGFLDADKDLQFQQGPVGMKQEDIRFPKTMVLDLLDLETGEEYQEEMPVTWRLAQPADMAEFDASLHVVLDNEGEPVLDENGMPVRDLLSYNWIFTPMLENSEDYDWSFLPDGYESWNAYQEEMAGIHVEVGIMVLPEAGAAYTLNLSVAELGTGGAERGYTFDSGTGELVLTADGGQYTLYPGITSTNPDLVTTPVNIKFSENVKTATLIIEGSDSNTGALNIMAYDNAPVIDFTGLNTANVQFRGTGNQITGFGDSPALVLGNCEVTFAGDKDAELILDNEIGVIISGGKLRIDSGRISVTPASRSGGDYPIENSMVSISDSAEFMMPFLLSRGTTVPEDTGFDPASNILFGEFDSTVAGRNTFNVFVSYTADGQTVRREFTKGMASYNHGFVMNLPAGSYQVYAETSGEGRKNLMGYASTDVAESSLLMNYSVSGLKHYVKLSRQTLPVFEESGVQEGTLTFNTVVLDGAVDTGRIMIGDSGYAYQGSVAILDKGFSLYSDEGCTKLVGRWNANGKRVNADGSVVPDTAADRSDKDATLPPFSVAVGGLVPGQTYWVRPYMDIGSGKQDVLEYVDSWDYTARHESKFSFTTPKVEYPSALTMTYGTTVDAALNRQKFDKINDVKEGVSVAFPEGSTLFGSNMEGRYHLYRDEGMIESADNQILTVPESGTFWIHYEPSGEDAGKYRIPARQVTVTVNPKKVTVTSVENTTKVYDANSTANVGEIRLGADDLLRQDRNRVTVEADSAVFVAVTEEGTTPAKDVDKASQILLSGLKLTGTASANYTLGGVTTFMVTDGAEITKRPITLAPKEMRQQAGTLFAPLELVVEAGSLAVKDDGTAELINGEVVSAYNTTTGQTEAEAAAAGNYFENVPSKGVDIGASANGSWYTVGLNVNLLNANSVNYAISGEKARFYFDAEYPILDGNYTITSGTPKNSNGWYNKPVTIAPKMGPLTGYYEEGYNQIQQMTANNSTATSKPWTANLVFSTTQDNVWIRLRNTDTGASTYINQASQNPEEGAGISLKIDTAAPRMDGDYKFTDENSEIINFLSTHLGNFFNRKVTVTFNLTDGTEGDQNVSGLWKIGWSYEEADGIPVYDGKNVLVLSSADGVAQTEASFQIPEKQAGNVSFYVMDRAENRKDYEVKAGDSGNYWIVESTEPKIDVEVQNAEGTSAPVEPAYTADGNIWYNQKIRFKANVSDVTADGEERSGLYAILRTLTMEGTESQEEALTAGLSDGDAVVQEKELIAYSITADSDPDKPVSIKLDIMDNAGNRAKNAYTLENILVDLTKPNLSVLAQSPATDTNQAVTISFTASDAGSGLKTVTYAKQSGDGSYEAEETIQPPLDGNYAFDVNTNGTYRVTVVDNVGHVSQQTITIGNIDKLSPEVPVLTLDDKEWDKTADEWQKSGVTLTVTADDKAADADNKKSGLASYSYTITKNGIAQSEETKAWNSDAAANTISFTENGRYTVTVYVTDKAANSSEVSKSYCINIDTTDPVLTVDAKKHPESGAEEAYISNTWSKDKLTFTLTNINEGSQDSGVDYQVKIGAGDWQTLSTDTIGSLGWPEHVTAAWGNNMLTLTGDMQETLVFRAQSKAETSSNEITYNVKLAQTAPVLPQSEVQPEPQPTGWYNENNKDASAGQPTLHIPKPEATLSGSAVTVYFEYWDAALGENLPSGADGVNQKTVAFPADQNEFTIVLPNGTIADGQYYWRVWITDQADNVVGKEAVGKLVKIDETDPVIDIEGIDYTQKENPSNSIKALLNKLTWGFAYPEGIQVTIPVTDELSGNHKLYYAVVNTMDPDAEVTYQSTDITDGKASFLLDLKSSGIVKFYAVDKAGNQTEVQNLGADGNQPNPIWVIENAAPNIGEITYEGTMGDNDWYKTDVTVKTAIQDYGLMADSTTGPAPDEDAVNITAVSGLKSVEYQFGKAGTRTTEHTWNDADRMLASYNFGVTITEEGEAIPLQIWATDNAKNEAGTAKSYIKIDKVAPEFVDEDSQANKDALNNPSGADSYTLTFKITEETSGLDSVTVKRQGGAVANPQGEDVTDALTKDPDTGVYTLTVDTNADYTVTAKDKAGHSAEWKFTVRNFDRTAPVIGEIHIDGTQKDGVYVSEDIFVEVTATDPEVENEFHSGLKEYWIATSLEDVSADKYDSLEWKEPISWGTRAKLEDVGRLYLYVKVSDKAGNITVKPYGLQIIINNGKPDLVVKTAPGYNKWTNQDVSFTLTSVADLEADGSIWKVSRDNGGSYSDVSPTGNTTLPFGAWTTQNETDGLSHIFTAMPSKDEGTFLYKFYVEKVLGGKNAESGTYTVRLDKTAPETPIPSLAEPTGEPVEGAQGDYGRWFLTAPVLTLDKAEEKGVEGTEVAPVTIYYRIWQDADQKPGGDVKTAYTSPLRIDHEGTTYVEYWAEDEAGNVGVSDTKVFYVDTQDPNFIGDITVTPDDGSVAEQIVHTLFGNFFNKKLKVTVQIQDAGASGIDHLEYRIGTETKQAKLNQEKTEATFTIDVEEANNEDVSVILYDKAGRTKTSSVTGNGSTSKWTVENSAPVIETEAGSGSFTAPAGANAAGWYKENVTVTAMISDESGLSKASWSLSQKDGTSLDGDNLYVRPENAGAAYKKQAFEQEIPQEGEGLKVTLDATDNALNSASQFVTLNIDKTAPVINEAEINEDIPKEWVNANQEISFTITDALSKVDRSTIKVEKGWKDASDQFVSQKVITPGIAETEAASSKYSVSFMTDGYGWYKVSVEDTADNTDEYVFEVKHIDLVAPIAPSVKIYPESPNGRNGWYDTIPNLPVTEAARSVDVGGETNDNSSPVSTIYQLWKTEERVNDTNLEAPAGTPEVVYSQTAQPVITGSGYWHIKIWGKDEAGNITAGNTISNIQADIEHPVVDTAQITYNEKNADAVSQFLNWMSFGNFFKEKLLIRIPIIDNGYSGVDYLDYKRTPTMGGADQVQFEKVPVKDPTAMEDGRQTAYAEITLEVGKEEIILYRVYDKAGNTNLDLSKPDTEEPEILTLTGLKNANLWVGDNQAPQVTAAPYADGNDAGWHNANVELSFTVQDYPNEADTVNSGLNQISWDGRLLTNGDGIKFLGADGIATQRVSTAAFKKEAAIQGEHTYIVTAKDNAGNETDQAGQQSITLKIDTVKPASSYPQGTPDLTTPSSESIPVTIRVTDATSKAVKDTIILKDADGNDVRNDASKIEEWKVTPIQPESVDAGKAVSQEYEIMFKIAVNGTYTLEAKDLADNEMDPVTFKVENINKSDVARPAVTVNTDGIPGSSNWFNTKPTKLTITNREPALDTMSYVLKTGADTPEDIDYQPLTFTFGEDGKVGVAANETLSIEQDGKYTLYLKVLQDTGKSDVFTFQINVDTTSPEITCTEADIPTDWVQTEQIIHFSITDAQAEASTVKEDTIVLKKGEAILVRATNEPAAEADLDAGQYFIKANGNGGYDGYFKTNGNGTYTIAAKDMAENAFAENGSEYKAISVSWIDTDAPAPAPEIHADQTAVGKPVEGQNGHLWYKEVPTLTWTTAKLNGEEDKAGVSEVTSTYEKYAGETVSGSPQETSSYNNSNPKQTPAVTEGIWTFKTWAQDAAGWTTKPHESTYWVDVTKPEIRVSYNPTGTTSGTVTITVTLTDATSKIDTDTLSVTRVSGMNVPADLNLKKVDETTYQFTITVSENSEYKINVQDKAGNPAEEKTAKVSWIDTSQMPIAPVTYGSIPLTSGSEAGWYKAPVETVTVEKAQSTETAEIHTTVTVTKPDGTVETKELKDGQTTSVQVTLDQDGIWKIRTDSEKQVTPVTDSDRRTDNYTIKVDTTIPVITDVAIKDETIWTNGDQTVTFTVTDPADAAEDGNVSGVKTVTVKDPEGKDVAVTVTENGSCQFTATGNGIYKINAADHAENSAVEVSVEITHIDKTKPDNITEDQVHFIGGTEGKGNWWKGPNAPKITMDVPVPEAGKAPVQVWWKLDYRQSEETAWTLGTETQYTANDVLDRLTQDGVYRLTVWTQDDAGNRTADADIVKLIYVDTKAPVTAQDQGITVKPAGTTALEKIGNFLTFGNFFKEALRVTVTAQDSPSGNDYLYYAVGADDVDTDRTENRVQIKADGTAEFDIPLNTIAKEVKFKLEDKAGNISDNFQVEGDEGSLEWTIENQGPEISGFEADRKPNEAGWYNDSVAFTAKITDKESYLNLIDWIVTGDAEKALDTDKQEGDKTHNLFTRAGKNDKVETKTINQTITVDGQTTVDITAQDNALNETVLSNAVPDAVTTIWIDTHAPVAAYVSGNPEDWVSEEQIITFTVTDTPETEGILHSGVDDPSVKVMFEKSSGNPEAEDGEITLLTRSKSGNTWTYTFETRGNGKYIITAEDVADNAAEALQIIVTNINTKELEAPKSTDSNWNRGYVSWTAPTGEKHPDSSDSFTGWYAKGENPTITIKNSDPGPDSLPITTVYKLWNSTTDGEPADAEAKEIGYEADLTPKTVVIKTKDEAWTDGTWKLVAWNVPEAGVRSPKAEWTFVIDNTSPTVSETPEELKEINTDGWQKLINKLSFGLFYKEAIEVTVQVEDVTSLGKTLYYQIETEKDGSPDMETGKADIKLDAEDATIGYAKFKLPIGTKGKIAMWAEDFAGNISAELDGNGNPLPDSGQVYLGYNGVTWWELESMAPSIMEVSPAMDEKDVTVHLKEIVLTFDERVTAAEGKTVTISCGGEYYDYTLTKEDTERIYLATPADASADMDDPGNVHGTYKVALNVNQFIERITGESLSLSYGMDYIIRAEKGAFLDLATNEQASGVYSVFTTEDGSKIENPEITDLTVDGGEYIQIYPEFSRDNTEYVIVVADGALNGDKSQLAQDMILKAVLSGDVELTGAVLKNFMGITIEGNLPIAADEGSAHAVIAADLIRAKDNYILQLTISDHGKEQTYTFYVSTSAVTASKDYLTNGMPKVEVNTDELLVSLLNEDLTEYVQKGLKVNIRMDLSAPSLDSVPEEVAAFEALRTALGDNMNNITYYPFDFTIWKMVSNGEMEKIPRLKKPITMKVPIPASIDLKYFRNVYRYHDGVPYVVEFTLDEENRMITFEADEFSVYALSYYKQPTSGGNGGSGGSGGSGGGGGGGSVRVGAQVAYYGGSWQNDGWVFIKSDGTKPSNEWLTINGKIYRFSVDGFMKTSFEKYQFNNDGSLASVSAETVKEQAPVATGTWLRDGWRYKAMNKTYLSGGWYYLYYNGLFDWYYFNDEGWMLDGWFANGGETYYLHTTHDWSRGRMYMGWQVIDGKWYYFRMKADGKEGTLMRNSYTPDGHFVGADGAWDGRGSIPTAYVRK